MIRKESVIRGRHLHLIKLNFILFYFIFENQEKFWKLLAFRVFIAVAYLFFRVVFNYIYIIYTFELYLYLKCDQFKIFYRYYFGNCFSELAQLVLLPFSWERSTRYSDKLDVTRMSMSTVPFLAQLDSGTLWL